MKYILASTHDGRGLVRESLYGDEELLHADAESANAAAARLNDGGDWSGWDQQPTFVVAEVDDEDAEQWLQFGSCAGFSLARDAALWKSYEAEMSRISEENP